MSTPVPSAVSSVGGRSGAARVAVASPAVPTARSRRKALMSDDTKETVTAEAAEAAFAVSPPVASTSISREGCVASVPAAGAAVAVASSATLRRMYERKEDMCPAVGGGAVTGSGSVSTATPTPVVDYA